jgi:hypothetical protein
LENISYTLSWSIKDWYIAKFAVIRDNGTYNDTISLWFGVNSKWYLEITSKELEMPEMFWYKRVYELNDAGKFVESTKDLRIELENKKKVLFDGIVDNTFNKGIWGSNAIKITDKKIKDNAEIDIDGNYSIVFEKINVFVGKLDKPINVIEQELKLTFDWSTVNDLKIKITDWYGVVYFADSWKKVMPIYEWWILKKDKYLVSNLKITEWAQKKPFIWVNMKSIEKKEELDRKYEIEWLDDYSETYYNLSE